MNQRDLDRKHKKADMRRARAAEKRRVRLKAGRFEKVDGGWRLPDTFITGKYP